MTFRLFPRRDPKPYGWVDPEKASYVPSAERAWPLRGGPRRSPEEYRAIRERGRRIREQFAQQDPAE